VRCRALLIGAVLAVAASRGAHADVQQWTELGIGKDLTKRWSASFDQHLRFDEDLSRVESVMPEAGIGWRPKRWLRFSLGYRLQYQRDGSGDMALRHRLHTAVRARYALGDVRLEYRLQLQEQLRPGSKDPARHTLRDRAEVSYRRFKPWVPGASVELFHAIADGDAIRLDKLWLTLNAAHSRKSWSAEVFYRVEVPIADAMDPTLHILGVGVHYDL